MTGTAQFAGLLIQTAVVYRRPQSDGADLKDRFGQPVRAGSSEASPSHNLACRCTRASGGRQFGERAQDVVEVSFSLFLEPGADLVEDDVVTVLAAPTAGADVATSKHIVTKAVVKLVRPVFDGIGEHHVEAILTSQRPATSAADGEPA